ncbi:DUF1361 domain-containing protein [Janibacter sp. CX7]|uniref:DUF1361 domain-containing protein n=1 Tax=Janibacter sp. CX7 TaxID=2963431 RepID=UPI0020CF321B|nr:DUF1361 domain-containing protein [Janibacter sp. CX7]UTT65878.1 DUF1361 domain-containing protein [Janibacter sp. CX7]
MAHISHPARWLTGLTLLLLAGTAVAAGLQNVRADRAGAPVFAFLFWNLFLAWVPYLVALALVGLDRLRAPGWLLAGVGVVWLLFLPNAPYILTDFIHVGAIPGAPQWFDVLLIGSFAATGLLLGLASLLLVHHVVARRLGAVAGWVLAVGSLALSSIGVYLGRFPRFNSWDVLTNPHGLVEVVGYRLADPLGNPFLVQFALAMTAGLLVSYLATWAVGQALAEGRRRGVAQYGG